MVRKRQLMSTEDDLGTARQQEIELLRLIFPDIDVDSKGVGSIAILLAPSQPIPIEITVADSKKSYRLTHLPPVKFEFFMTRGYPFDEAPHVDVVTSSLSGAMVQKIKLELLDLWNSYKDLIIFSMIDHMQHSMVKYIEPKYIQELASQDLSWFEMFVNANEAFQRQEFEMETFTCQICQDDFKGTKCTQFRDCKHVFCDACLHDYFKSMITSGHVESVHCPDFQCITNYAKDRAALVEVDRSSFTDFVAFKNKLLERPIESSFLHRILSTGFSEEECTNLISRYEELFLKNQHRIIAKNFDHRLVDCPRFNCGTVVIRDTIDEDLVRCSKCYFAFCYWCGRSWHGDREKCKFVPKHKLYRGIPTEDLEAWNDESLSSDERMRLETIHGRKIIRQQANEFLMDKLFKEAVESESGELQECPSCNTVIQKSDGCNKMRCTQCATFFCYLCGDILLKNDPYLHFNFPGAPCYGRLFEGMEGVDDP